MIGQSIAHYRITAKLGEGGMGAVYRATDTKLNREVALKILAADLERFEREAQVLAALNHPNIAAVYGVEQNAIVMELVEGETLQGPVPMERALDLARQLVDAFEYAHEKGVIHRDLKPANIKITPEGVLKVLDFGLAKLSQPETPGPNQPTLTLTIKGAIMGTPAYMAPEQARAQEVDRRADIWAFGAVLHELLSGTQIFTGETVTDILASVVKSEPDWSALPSQTPLRIRRLLALCLAKDRKHRLQAIGDAHIFFEAEAEAERTPVQTAKRSILPWALAAASTLALIVAGAGWYLSSRPAPLRPLIALNAEISPDTPMGRTGTNSTLLAISPDGSRLALVLRGPDGQNHLYTRRIHQNQVARLLGTVGAEMPFFSPDGQWIGFAAEGKLKKISVEGGAAVVLCDAPVLRGASWADDGTIVAALNVSGGLSRLPSSGGAPVPVTKVNSDERTHRHPRVLPGSQAVLFVASSSAGDYSNAAIDLVSFKTGERKTIRRGGFSPRYLSTSDGAGYLLYLHKNTLFAAPFDLGRLSLAGEPAPVLDDVSSVGAGGHFDFSQSGTFVYLPGKSQFGGWSISWLDTSGKIEPLHPQRGGYFGLRLSPDGKRLAYNVNNTVLDDIWVKDIERDTASRLTFLPGVNRNPVWTPDGRNIVFLSANHPNEGIYIIASDGSGEPHRLTDGKLGDFPSSISPDGRRLAFARAGNDRSPDIFTAPIEGDPAHPKLGKPDLFLGTPFSETSAEFSPDGRWLAYQSNESGAMEVYVRPFPGPGGRWQISTGGGGSPAWSRDGRELLFQERAGRIMAVAYSTKGASFIPGATREWPSSLTTRIPSTRSFDPTPDGKRLAAFLTDDSASGEKPQTHLTFLLNLQDELQRRAPK